MKLFIYKNWDTVCKGISENFYTIRADEVLDNIEEKKWLVVKHDVETDVKKALKLAEIEHQYGICATYYVQADLLEENVEILQNIAALGHEVSYHYDVLDACDGDYEEAIESFTAYKDCFESYGFPIKTVCPHGNPIKIRAGWSSNKDFFRDTHVNALFPNVLDIVVHLPSSITRGYTYISDAGYTFQEIGNIHNNDTVNHGDIKIEQELIQYLATKKHIILSTHPHRWESSTIKFVVRVYGFKLIRSIAKKLASIPFFRKVMSKYYYLAKKI